MADDFDLLLINTATSFMLLLGQLSLSVFHVHVVTFLSCSLAAALSDASAWDVMYARAHVSLPESDPSKHFQNLINLPSSQTF